MVINPLFWENKNVFITGHTGFKGGWLTLWLQLLGANVTGFALPPSVESNLFSLIKIDKDITHIIGDIRDQSVLCQAIIQAKPEIIFHLAAQPLVRYSYQNPLETYTTNVIGTVNLFEAIRQQSSVKAIINITSDKCYENKEWLWGYREDDTLGGFDPYSNSKACSELVTKAYRRSFFSAKEDTKIASARAGNVIGGGDWSTDRLIPDIIRAHLNHQTLVLRYPNAIRPWQYVLEPLTGYLLLAQRLCDGQIQADEAWNFGPDESGIKTVQWIAQTMQAFLGEKIATTIEEITPLYETNYLKLDCSKAKSKLKWQPVWSLEKGLQETADWYRAYHQKQDMRAFSLQQIKRYVKEL